MASLASQIELFGLGKRALEEKFTKSEMMILAWRSMEMAHNLEKDMPTTTGVGVPRKQQTGQLPEDLPDHFFNEEGEVDLRNVRGEEAYRFMQMQGIKLPIMTGNRGTQR